MNVIRSRIRHCRSGSVLVMFAVASLGILALAALLVDVSLFLLTRRQMQTAVNVASTEGLRFQDDFPSLSTLVSLLDNPASCPDLADRTQVLNSLQVESGCAAQDTCLRNYVRRKAASLAVRHLFDDDFDTTNGDLMNLGAGPVIQYSGGTPTESPVQADTLHSGQLISIPSVPVYKPLLELNTANNVEGDLIHGSHNADSPHLEAPAYTRSDFDLAGKDAFLARLRRTGESFASGVGTSGPPVPFLFGHFAVGADDGLDPALLNRRRSRGTLVRSTGIASAKPALTVGVPLDIDSDGVADPNRDGVACYWLDQTEWAAAAEGLLTLSIAPDGLISGDVSGRFVANETSPRQVIRVGDVLPAVQVAAADLELGKRRFVPLYHSIGGTMVAVGFGVVVLESSTSVRKLPGMIAPENASNVLTSPSNSLTAAEWAQIFSLQAAIVDSLVKAPAHVRAIP